MNITSPNVASDKDSKVSLEFPKKMWLIEWQIVKKYHDFYHETVSNSDDLIPPALKYIAS